MLTSCHVPRFDNGRCVPNYPRVAGNTMKFFRGIFADFWLAKGHSSLRGCVSHNLPQGLLS